MFEFKKQENPLRYQMLGFETKNFFLNSGTLFFLFFSWFILIILYLFLKTANTILKNKKTEILLNFVSKWIFFNFIIRVLIESYIDLGLTSLINIDSQFLKENGEYLSTFFSFFVISFLIAFPIGSYIIIAHRYLVIRGV